MLTITAVVDQTHNKKVAERSPAVGFIFLLVAGFRANCCSMRIVFISSNAYRDFVCDLVSFAPFVVAEQESKHS